MKRSPLFTAGIYQWEWQKDKIALVEWDEVPTSTNQWVRVEPSHEFKYFYLEGTSNDDIKVVGYEDGIEFYSMNG